MSSRTRISSPWPGWPPTAWTMSGSSGLGRILRLALDSGNVVEDFVTRLRAALKLPPGEAPLTERQAAKVLFAADCTIEAGEFLPGPEKAEADNDREALNLLARHYLADARPRQEDRRTSSGRGRSRRPPWPPARSIAPRRTRPSAAPSS